MFSFLKIFNSKPDDVDKNETDNSNLNGKTLNLSNFESKTHCNNNRTSPVAFKLSRTNTTFGTKRCGDFSVNICHPQKKARTRNNEILSSYSSSKFLLKPGRKRSYQTDNEDELPDRKHCKNCLCCASVVLFENDQNILNTNVKTTENDVSDNFVTVAAGRIFNRSGKTQVIKKMCKKSILHEILDDVDLTPYTSIEKVEEKKKKSQNKATLLKQHTDKSDLENDHHSSDLMDFVSSTKTNILPVASSDASLPKDSINMIPSECVPKINEGDKSSSSLQFDSDRPKVSSITSTKSINKQTDESTNKLLTFQITKSTMQISSEQREFPFRSPEKTENYTCDEFQTGSQSDFKNDNDKFSFQSTTPVSKYSEYVTNASGVVDPSNSNETELPAIHIDCEHSSKDLFTHDSQNSLKPSTLTFERAKLSADLSAPLMQFDTSISDNQQSLSRIQFEKLKVNDKLETSDVQFGIFKVDDMNSTPFIQFDAPEVDREQSTPLIQFGVPISDNQESINSSQFGTIEESENSISTSLFLFDNNAKSSENIKSAKPIKCQFGSPKFDHAYLTDSDKLPFGYQSKPFSNQPNDNQKLVFGFGSKISANKPAPDVLFTDNTTNPVFQLNNSGCKLNYTVTDTPCNSHSFSTEAASSFGIAQDFGVKTAFQFGSSKAEESKTQFSTTVFRSQNTTTVPFKFGENEKPVSFGRSVPYSNRPLQCTDSVEKPAEPFKFGSTVSSGSVFQYNINKAENGPVQLGQVSDSFPAPGFNSFGDSPPQQNLIFGDVPSQQTSSLSDIASANAVHTFDIVTSHPSITFGTNQNFQLESVNNAAPSNSSTFVSGTNYQSTKSESAFKFNVPPKTNASSFQFNPTSSAMSTSQSGETQYLGLPVSSQPLFSTGTAPAGGRRIAKATRRR